MVAREDSRAGVYELLLFRFRVRARSRRDPLGRGRARAAPRRLAGRRRRPRRGRRDLRAPPRLAPAGSRMGRFLHRGDRRPCPQRDRAPRLCRRRDGGVADRPDRQGWRGDRPGRARAGRQDPRSRAQCPRFAQGLGAGRDRELRPQRNRADPPRRRRPARNGRRGRGEAAAPDRLRRRRRRRPGGQPGGGRDAVADQGLHAWAPPTRPAGKPCSSRRSATI